MSTSPVNSSIFAAQTIASASTSTPAPQSQAQAAQQTALVQAVKTANQAQLFGTDNELTFVMDRATRRAVVQIVDRDTRRVIQQIPNESVLRIAQEYDGG